MPAPTQTTDERIAWDGNNGTFPVDGPMLFHCSITKLHTGQYWQVTSASNPAHVVDSGIEDNLPRARSQAQAACRENAA